VTVEYREGRVILPEKPEVQAHNPDVDPFDNPAEFERAKREVAQMDADKQHAYESGVKEGKEGERAKHESKGRSSGRGAAHKAAQRGRGILRKSSAPYRRTALGAAVTVTGLFFACLLLILLYILLINGSVVAKIFTWLTGLLEDLMDPAKALFTFGSGSASSTSSSTSSTSSSPSTSSSSSSSSSSGSPFAGASVTSSAPASGQQAATLSNPAPGH